MATNFNPNSVFEQEANGDEQTVNSLNEEKFAVEKILKKETRNGAERFFVKWEGYNNRHNTWIRRENFVGFYFF